MNPDDVIKILEAIKEMASPATQQVFAYAVKAKTVEGLVGMLSATALFLIGIGAAWSGWRACRKGQDDCSDGWWAVGIITSIIGLLVIIGATLGFGVSISQYLAPELPAIRALLGK